MKHFKLCSGILVLFIAASPAVAAPAGTTTSQTADAGDTCAGSTQYPCVLIYEPPSDGGGSSNCPTPHDAPSCELNCICNLNKNLKTCEKEGGGMACRRGAEAEKRACDANCLADWP